MPQWLLDWLASTGAEAAVFLSAFISATLIPGGSEVFLVGALTQTPDNVGRIARLILLAGLGNTLGAMTSWGIGRMIPHKETSNFAQNWLKRYGAPALVLSWLPVVGDALPVAAGWLRMPFWSSLFWVAIGKFLRYLTVTWVTLSML